MPEYAPNYVPRDAEAFERMLNIFRECEDPNQLRMWTVAYTLDMSYPREDIVVAIGRVEREKGWHV